MSDEKAKAFLIPNYGIYRAWCRYFINFKYQCFQFCYLCRRQTQISWLSNINIGSEGSNEKMDYGRYCIDHDTYC